jgi:hypothetical protein
VHSWQIRDFGSHTQYKPWGVLKITFALEWTCIVTDEEKIPSEEYLAYKYLFLEDRFDTI